MTSVVVDSNRPSDVTIFGATGFTGALACAYIDRVILLAREQQRAKTDVLQFQNDREFLHLLPGTQDKASLKWYIAGRDEAKLREMLGKYTTCSGIVIADSKNQAQIDDMVKQTRVLLSFAGPFALYGTPVVDACVRFGTHYCDSTGEVPWVNSLSSKYHELAKKNGTKIVPMCGFDCVPSDLGVLYAVTKLRELRPQVRSVKQCTTFANTLGGMSGGTTYTFMLMENDALFKDPFALGGGPHSKEQRELAYNPQSQAKFSQELGLWTAPFMMEMLNTRVVRKSADALQYRDADRGGFLYSECALARNEQTAQRMAKPGPSQEVRKKLIAEGKMPSPGQGPDHDFRRKSRFRMFIKAEGEQSEDVCWVAVTGGDAGYEDTSAMCVEAALAMALDLDALPAIGGVLTPSVAIGTAFIERLQLAGIRFRVFNHRPITAMAAL